MSKLLGEVKKTPRNFEYVEFRDITGEQCSIQQSSTSNVDAIWLGCEHETIHKVTGQKCGARMHLSFDLVMELIPLLQHWVKTKQLSGAPANPEPTREELLECLRQIVKKGEEYSAAQEKVEETGTEEDETAEIDAMHAFQNAMADAERMVAKAEGREL